MMKKMLIALGLLLGSVASASAACTSPAVMKDNASTTFNMSLATNAGDGNCASNVTVVGTVPLPTGAATSALQTTGNTSLTTINTTLGTPMQNSGGSLTANAGTNLNTSALGTSANQTSQITQETATAAVLGTTGDTVCATATGTCTIAALLKYNNNTAPVLGAGSAVIGKVGIDQTTRTVTNGVMNAGSNYQAVAASQTATVLQTSTGATGDYLSHCVIYPASTSPGVVTVFDSTNTAANSAILFAGGASSTSNLTPIPVPVGALSVNGAWKVTTGSSVSVVCYGKFS